MSKRPTQSQQALALLYHARAATPFFSEGGEPCAAVPSTVDSCRVLPLRSADFRDWLTANYFAEYEVAPSEPALRAVLRTLEARAHGGTLAAQKVDHRIGFEGDPYAPSRVFLDLANAAGEILEIGSQGWHVTDNLGRSFRQSPGMLPLPSPESAMRDPGSALCSLFHLSAEACPRVLFWLAAALRPIGPYPILVLRGAASSGKSTLARALRTLIDPSSAPIHRLPASDRELQHLARHNWILVFDQVHRIPVKISEALCALASGEAMETAQPDYRDAAVSEIARPIILVAPVDETQLPFTPTRSLSTRSLAVNLAPIAHTRPEAAVWSDFEALRAPLLATLADAVSTALKHIREVDLPAVVRFPDCAAWAVAAAPALGLDPEALIHAISTEQSMWVGTDPLRDAVHTLLGAQSAWSGDSAALLSQLRALAPLATLPRTGQSLLVALARVTGISVSRSGRTFTIARAAVQSASSQTPNP
ncbi:MAG TPA: hypothetical protein VFW44_11950 [Bryobacteraceae bacterium]|nr:hypothetical protein [Bryobacteraceae bacterium]